MYLCTVTHTLKVYWRAYNICKTASKLSYRGLWGLVVVWLSYLSGRALVVQEVSWAQLPAATSFISKLLVCIHNCSIYSWMISKTIYPWKRMSCTAQDRTCRHVPWLNAWANHCSYSGNYSNWEFSTSPMDSCRFSTVKI